MDEIRPKEKALIEQVISDTMASLRKEKKVPESIIERLEKIDLTKSNEVIAAINRRVVNK